MSQRAMFTAISGIRNQQTQIDVIANNVANSSTIGFKKGRMTFEETFALLLQGASRPPGDQGGVNPLQVGNGAAIGSIDNIFGQGNIQSTGTQTDLAIRGDGFFVVSNGQRDYFTRDGAFQWDSNGQLVIPTNGMKVQGRIANATGVVDEGSALGDIVVPFGTVDPAKATTSVQFVGNLDASTQPQGNILEAERLYAKEEAGSTTDMNGLYANGNADLQISGLSANSTTVTVTTSNSNGGNAITQNYTYVKEDTGTGSKDFNSLDNLMAEINNDFNTLADPSMNVALDTNGSIVFTNLGQVNNTLTISSVNSVLNSALASANGVVGARTSDQFSHVATSTDSMINLRDSAGADLGLTIADSISVMGRVGGVEIDSVVGGNPDAFVITVDNGNNGSITYGEFIQSVKDSFGITNQTGVEIDAQKGNLKINADGGLDNEISAVNISTANRAVFDNVFDSTVGNWRETQTADDVSHAASVRVYDSLGNAHTLTLEFKKDVRLPNTWQWSVSVPEPAEVSGGFSGTISFDNTGNLESTSYSQGASSFTFDPKNGATVPMDIVLDFGTLGASNGLSQFSNNSTVIARHQDGYSSGALNNVTIDDTGTITGLFSNGNSRIIAKCVLATFNNSAGLERIGDNMYDVSANSGIPIYGLAGTSINATIIPGAVEMSNVDLAEEFTNMIVAQRTFQANARTVTTSDDLLLETVNLKR